METPETDNRFKSLFWLSYIAVVLVSAIIGTLSVIIYDSYMLGILLYFLSNIVLSWILLRSFLKLSDKMQ